MLQGGAGCWEMYWIGVEHGRALRGGAELCKV